MLKMENSLGELNLPVIETIIPLLLLMQGGDKDGWVIRAEVYGDGVDIWLRGQGDIIDVLE